MLSTSWDLIAHRYILKLHSHGNYPWVSLNWVSSAWRCNVVDSSRGCHCFFLRSYMASFHTENVGEFNKESYCFCWIFPALLWWQIDWHWIRVNLEPQEFCLLQCFPSQTKWKWHWWLGCVGIWRYMHLLNPHFSSNPLVVAGLVGGASYSALPAHNWFKSFRFITDPVLSVEEGWDWQTIWLMLFTNTLRCWTRPCWGINTDIRAF